VNTLLSKLGLILLCLPSSLLAAWSGVSLSLGDETIPVTNGSEQLTLTPFRLNLQVEERTKQGLRIGAEIAKVGIQFDAETLNVEATGDALGVYFYLPYQFNASLGLVSRLSFSYVSTSSVNDLEVSVDYLTKSLSVGIALRLHNIRVIPSINARIINGDFRQLETNNSFSFEQKQITYSSVFIDYFVEKNSFVRLGINEHSDNTFQISFSTIY